MDNEQDFNTIAVAHLEEIYEMLVTNMAVTGMTRKECLHSVVEQNKEVYTDRKTLYGFAILGYGMAKDGMKKGNYRQFFIGLTALTTFSISPSNQNEKEILSAFSKNNAFKRHAETYAIKEQVIEYWKENIDPKLSNDKAAEILLKANIAPIQFRTLSDYVSEAKKR